MATTKKTALNDRTEAPQRLVYKHKLQKLGVDRGSINFLSLDELKTMYRILIKNKPKKKKPTKKRAVKKRASKKVGKK